MRQTSNHYKCVLCGNVVPDIICISCAEAEKAKQRAEPGSLTEKQFNYIEHLISGLDSQTTGQIIYSVLPDYEGDFSTLSCEQAAALIRVLVENNDKPRICERCKVNETESKHHELCRKCFDEVVYNGVPLVQCAATNYLGKQCGHKGHFKNGFCHIHDAQSTSNAAPA